MAELHLQPRSLYHDQPPGLQTPMDMNPTLLVSWWCTIFALVTILIRLMGRWVRTERLFREDKIMLYSIIPLMIRMGLVHVILIWGTNNTVTTGLTPIEIMHRETGSKLVLVSRIFYATFIWVAKLTVLEFLKRTVGPSWVTSYEGGLRSIYGFLALTYVGVIVGTLTECRPFHHYWQVVPDPGPKCREGLVQLITMGVCDMVSDVVLIVFPIPLVMRSSMPFRKKFSLVLLFLLSLVLIGITAFRIPSTISRKSSQQYRSLLASLEILAATGVSNAVVIGSFIRDKGVKKAKFRVDSKDEPAVLNRARTRTISVTQHHWGSDEDLARGVGVALPPALQHVNTADQVPRVAPLAPPGPDRRAGGMHHRHPKSHRHHRRDSDDSYSSISTTDIKLRDLESQMKHYHSDNEEDDDDDDEHIAPGKLTFFDVGGLVDNSTTTPTRSRNTSVVQATAAAAGHEEHQSKPKSSSKAFLSDIGGLLHPSSSTSHHHHHHHHNHSHNNNNNNNKSKTRSASNSRSRSHSPSKSNSKSKSRSRSRSIMKRRHISRSPGPRKGLDRDKDKDKDRDHGDEGHSGGSGQRKQNDPFNFSDAGGLLS